MRIFVVSAYGYWGDVSPEDFHGTRQIGGGETAMMHVSKELAALGHEVFVFYNTPRGQKFDGVDYVPMKFFTNMACSIEHDVLVSWDSPAALRFASRQKKTVLAFQLNDTYVGPFSYVIDQ